MSKKKSKSKRKSAKFGQPTPWDALFKAFFSHKIIVESLLTSFLAQDIQTGIDWTTLEPWNSSHVTKALKQRFNDCLWRVRTDNEFFYFYFMLEFQRTTDKLMPLRIAEYNALLLQGLHKARVIGHDGKYPPVISIVLYIGEEEWTAPLSIDEARHSMSQELQELQLQQKYILLNANTKTAGNQETLAELLFAICDSKPDQVEAIMGKIEVLLMGDEYDNLRQLFVELINYAVLQPAEIKPIDKTINFTEAKEMMAAKALRWREEIYNEGLAKGVSMMEANAEKWRKDIYNEGVSDGINMMEAKAKKWREEIYNEGLAKGISMMEAKEAENSVTLKKEAKADVALKMLKAGKPRSEIVLFTDLSEAELDNIVLKYQA